MANTSNIFISSKGRLNGTDAAFSTNLNPLVSRVQSWYFSKISLDFSWYVIDSSNEDFIFEEIAGFPITVKLTHGSPSASNLLADLVAKMNAATTVAAIYAAVLNPSTQKITISSTKVFEIPENSGMTKSLRYVLGFLNPDTFEDQPGAPGNSFTAASVAHISGPSTVYLYSSFLNLNSVGNSSPNANGMQRSNAMCQIPVNVNFGGVIQYEERAPVVYDYKMDNFTNIDFQLRDSFGKQLNLNGGDMNIQIVFRHFDN